MTAPVVQLFITPRPGLIARHRVAALKRAFERAGAKVLATASVSGRLEIDPRSTHVCAVGGDGTLRHVVEAVHLSGRSLAVSVYPAGTVNLLARERGYPRSPQRFVRRVLDSRSRTELHTALVNGMPFVTCASVGPDSFAVARLSDALKTSIGRAAYLAAFCELIFAWPRPTMTLSWGNNCIASEAVYIAKGHFFAGPWTFAPRARASDPLLHVVSIDHASRLQFARFAWRVLRGRSLDAMQGVNCFTCTELTIGGAPSLPLQADGDVVGHLPATITVRPQSTIFA